MRKLRFVVCRLGSPTLLLHLINHWSVSQAWHSIESQSLSSIDQKFHGPPTRTLSTALFVASGNNTQIPTRATTRATTSGTTRAMRAAARGRQNRTADRLADPTAVAPDLCGFEGGEYLCTDGITLMPYAVAGKVEFSTATATAGVENDAPVSLSQPESNDLIRENSVVMSFVAVHDFFDTLEKTFLLFKPLILRNPGCQVLCFNSPGQAGTQLPPEPEGLLTNDWVADRLNELMQVRKGLKIYQSTSKYSNDLERLRLYPKYIADHCKI